MKNRHISDLKPYITISLTDACNLRCVYCPPSGENYNTPAETFDPAAVEMVLDLSAELNLGKIRFTGGEPLLYPHLQRVMEYAAGLGLEIHMNTNGLLLDKHLPWLQTIPNLVIKVSLDAVTDKGMRQVSGVAGVERVIEATRRAAQLGLVQRLNFVLTRLNMDQFPAMLELCRSMGIGLKVFDMFPVPETDTIWQTFYAAPDGLPLDGEPAEPYLYTLKYGTPTRELWLEGVHVRIKNCFDGTHYHATCHNCSFFPCPEGLYCLVITPSLTVIPCRLGTHHHRVCRTKATLQQAVESAITLYDESYYANNFGALHHDFYVGRVAGAKQPV